MLGWWDVSLYHRFEQGQAFTWNPESLQRLQGVYNKRYKNYNRTDLHIEKRMTLAGINAGLFMDVTNLLNTKNLNQYTSIQSSVSSLQLTYDLDENLTNDETFQYEGACPEPVEGTLKTGLSQPRC